MSCTLIHTADWHLGNRLHKVDRTDEFQSFLRWVKDEAVRQNADTLVVSGDVFDTINPPTESRTQYNDFLASLQSTCCKNVIIVGGNHDSASLLDSEKGILGMLNIHVVGSASGLSPEDMVFELKKESGETSGICMAVPFVHEVELRSYCDAESENENLSDAAYGVLYKNVLDAAKKLRGERSIPIIATGHLYCTDLEGRFSCTEKEISSDDGRHVIDGVVGNLGSVHSSVFSDEIDYVALGHIHYSTKVSGENRIRYSGSPFILGFDEHNISHGILSVKVERGKEPEVQKIDVPKTADWKRITGKSAKIRESLEQIIEHPPLMETNIEICYDFEENVDISICLEKTISDLPENVFVVNYRRNEMQDVGSADDCALEDAESDSVTDEEIFGALISARYEFDRTGLSDEEIRMKDEEIRKKYLPLFLEAVHEFENGVRYEN